ncbi:MAG: hydantoinase/oxoprolinase family protein [Acidobacteriia bacterium]|nr:hydantoinase/oxoprolinase family protein [Terriglobia bacterium]
MRIAVDSGGTFTDCVYLRDGRLAIRKVPSQPKNPAAAIAEALGQCRAERAVAGREALDLVCGTTVGTNALLERRGGRVALVTTAGFEDVLEIGRQARPKLYDFFVVKAEPLVPAARRIGAQERLAADGAEVTPLTARELRGIVRRVQRTGVEAVAVCFLFSFRNPRHEQQVAGALRAAGYLVSVSHEILPEFREFERTSTTVINAYLAPVMSRYLGETQRRAQEMWSGGRTLVRVMQSNGGIISAGRAAHEPVRTILSGPAGGVMGAQYAASLAGLAKVITFDMGGTSTDVALLGSGLGTTTESIVAGLPVAVPMLEIHTVGAGGGSLARIDQGGALRVGPESAGADPGPACYGRGEKPTVTDAHAVLGHFGGRGLLGGAFPLNTERARRQLEKFRGAFRTTEEFAEGILRVANAVMEKAIRVISVERGYDPWDYALVAFGGAGGLHACDLAGALEMRGVLLPCFPGGLSALGILRADVVKDVSRTVLLPVHSLGKARGELRARFRRLEGEGIRALAGEGFRRAQIRVERWVDVRYIGQAYELSVAAGGDFVEAFHRAHEQRYGYADRLRRVEVVNVRCRVTGEAAKPEVAKIPRAARAGRPPLAGELRCVFGGRAQATRWINREELRAGHVFAGPAVISEYSATTLVPPGWRARVDEYGQIFLAPVAKERANARR